MGYGIWTTAIYGWVWVIGCGIWTTATAGILGWDMGYIQAMDYSYIGMGMGYRLWVMDCMYYWYVNMGYGLQLYRDGWGVSYRYELWSMGICVGYVRLG